MANRRFGFGFIEYVQGLSWSYRDWRSPLFCAYKNPGLPRIGIPLGHILTDHQESETRVGSELNAAAGCNNAFAKRLLKKWEEI